MWQRAADRLAEWALKPLKKEEPTAKDKPGSSLAVPLVKSPPIIPPVVPVSTTVALEPEDKGTVVPTVQYEQFNKEYTQTAAQDNFDGFRLELQRPWSPTFQFTHSLMMGTSNTQGGFVYQFGPNYASSDGSLFAMCRITNEGSIIARAIRKFGSSIEARASAAASPFSKTTGTNMSEVALDFNGSDWATSMKVAWQGCFLINGSWAQRIHRHLHTGGDVTWVSANGSSIGSLGLRYTPTPSNCFSATVLRQPDFSGGKEAIHSIKMQYFRKISDRLNAGTELEVSECGSSALRLCYEYLFHQARIQGQVDSTGRVSVFAQEASGLALSGSIDYKLSDYKFGLMMLISPPPPGELPTESPPTFS